MQFTVISASNWPDITVQYTFDGGAGQATVVVSVVPLLRVIPSPTLAQAVTYLSWYGYAHAVGVLAATKPAVPAAVTAALNTPVTAASQATVAAAYALLGIT